MERSKLKDKAEEVLNDIDSLLTSFNTSSTSVTPKKKKKKPLFISPEERDAIIESTIAERLSPIVEPKYFGSSVEPSSSSRVSNSSKPFTSSLKASALEPSSSNLDLFDSKEQFSLAASNFSPARSLHASDLNQSTLTSKLETSSPPKTNLRNSTSFSSPKSQYKPSPIREVTSSSSNVTSFIPTTSTFDSIASPSKYMKSSTGWDGSMKDLSFVELSELVKKKIVNLILLEKDKSTLFASAME